MRRCGGAFMRSSVFIDCKISVERVKCSGTHITEAICRGAAVEGRAVDGALVSEGLGGDVSVLLIVNFA
jgi:hypothetical protein